MKREAKGIQPKGCTETAQQGSDGRNAEMRMVLTCRQHAQESSQARKGKGPSAGNT